MSLADLPDVLIAHLTNYLDYSDVCNLMETSKKNYNAIKGYKKDKIQCRSFRFTEDNNTINCTAHGDINDANVSYNYTKSYTFNTKNLGADKVANIAEILRECSNVASMDFHRMRVNEDIFKMLNNIEVKIGYISIIRSYVDSGPEEFISFCQKYGSGNYKYTGFCDKLLTDDVFEKIIPYVTFEMYDDVFYEIRQLQMTNRTLKAAFKCGSFEIAPVVTSFTIEGIVTELEILRRSEKTFLFANIGILLSTQLEAAHRYFNKNTGELKDIYEIEMNGYDGRIHYYVRSKNIYLSFAVRKR